MYSKFLESPESAVLGAILHDQSLWHQASAMVGSDDFQDPTRRTVFSIMQGLVNRGITPTPDEVNTELVRLYPSLVGDDYLAELMDRCPSLDIESHARAMLSPTPQPEYEQEEAW